VIHQAICAGCGGSDNLPVFPANVHSAVNNSSNCNMAGVQIAFEMQQAKLSLGLSADTVCAGDTLLLKGSTSRTDVLTIAWGDGQTSSGSPNPLPGHLYSQPGTYLITLTGIDSLCLTQAQQTLTVYVLPGSAVQADVVWTFDPCDSARSINLAPGPALSAQFMLLFSSNGSVDSLFAPFQWSGTALTLNYQAWLVAYDLVCGRSDSLLLTADFHAPLSAPVGSIIAPFCINGEPVRASGYASGATSYTWRVPGQGLIRGSDVQWSASLVGLQTVWLIVEDSLCGRRDSLQLTYEVFGAEFDSLSVPNVYTPNGDNINDVASSRLRPLPYRS
jgi:hypothetical protein